MTDALLFAVYLAIFAAVVGMAGRIAWVHLRPAPSTTDADRSWFREITTHLTTDDREWLTYHYRLAGVPAPPGVHKSKPPPGPGAGSLSTKQVQALGRPGRLTAHGDHCENCATYRTGGGEVFHLQGPPSVDGMQTAVDRLNDLTAPPDPGMRVRR